MASKEFSNKLKNLRLKAGYSQKDVYEHFDIPQSTFSSWEVGKSEPSGEMLLKLCTFYKCDMMKEFSSEDNLTYKEWTLIEKYRSLDSYGQESVNELLNRESKRIALYGKLGEKNVITLAQYESTKPPTHLIPYWEGGVSAGNGIYQLNDTSCIMMTLWDTEITKQADFIIKVNGNSMEPDYHNGDKVLVNRDIIVKKGDVGIFVKNSEAFIKELGDGELISRNPDFPNIPIQDFDNVVCLGKVIGILKDSLIAND